MGIANRRLGRSSPEVIIVWISVECELCHFVTNNRLLYVHYNIITLFK